jgi:hypothetical protein
MAVRSSAGTLSHGETPNYRPPLIRSKVWGFEPFWKFVNYDVDLSSNTSSTSSGGKNNFDDDFYFVGDNSIPAEKIEILNNNLSNKKNESSKGVERIIPIQRVRTTSLTVPPVKTATLTRGSKTFPLSHKEDQQVDTFSNNYRPSTRNDKIVDGSRKLLTREEKILNDLSNFNRSSSSPRRTDEVLSIFYKRAPSSEDRLVIDIATINNRRSPPREEKHFDERKNQQSTDVRKSQQLTDDRKSQQSTDERKIQQSTTSDRKSSSVDRRKTTKPTAVPIPSSSRYISSTLPIKIPSSVHEPLSATYYLGPKFDSLPNNFEVRKPTQLTSVLKKPGSGKPDRKSLKKVAFLESSY